MRAALVIGSLVENIVEVEAGSTWQPPADSQIIELAAGEQCEIGQQYNENSSPRFFGSVAPIEVSWSSYQFLLRFTNQERTSIRTAAASDDAVADFQQLAGAAHQIVNTDPITIAGMDYLVSVGILTQARRDEILTA